MKVVLIIVVVLLGIVGLFEVGLRVLFGFGNPLLYLADAEIGYLLAPNQQVKRFGNRIQINQYSMRSPEITLERPAATLRVLLLGDSVANGGWWTDQVDIPSEMMTRQLRTTMSGSDWQRLKQSQVLNASANSWGPRNELAYLKRYGHFDAQVVIVLINTDDLFATAPTALQVGRDHSYPDRKPLLALIELYTRYLTQSEPIPELEAIRAEGGDRVGTNLAAIEQMATLTHQNKSQLLVAMTPLLREIREPGPRDYEKKARTRLQDFMQSQQIPYLDFLPKFNAVEHPNALYRDHIHLSPAGNQFVSHQLVQTLPSLIPDN
ncbi:MAG: SGNH/GDSL hydrolase family protein [Cyanothece sp. SIO1E1]|nr:SGNH/GDSL hydrolase family protein [Cyanothece sp. SIO1E1]